MIQTLRKRLIGAAMLAVILMLLAVTAGGGLIRFRTLVCEADNVLAVLAQNKGIFPKNPEMFRDRNPDIRRGIPALEGREMSPETPFESRFFSVLMTQDGKVLSVHTDRIAAVDPETAAQCALQAADSGRQKGFWGSYRYVRSEEEGNVRFIFLDCGRVLGSFYSGLMGEAAVFCGVVLGVFALLLLLSGRIIRPVAESYEKQKQFITDAGHEIRTPLTIISADAELAEMEDGESEWLTDIRRQTQRLTDLTNDLIYLSRMDEARKIQSIEFPVSDVVEETAMSFEALAIQQGKKLEVSTQPMLSLDGCEKDIRKLTSILLDNALKYSPPDDTIRLTLHREGQNIRLSVQNTSAEPLDRERLSHLFDRFYRGDTSRSTSGYGLGLAIAQGIVASHGGKIRAEAVEDNTIRFSAVLPKK